MTLKKTIVLEVSMTSECSEATLSEHMNYFVNNVIQNVKDQSTASWNCTVSPQIEESYPVEIEVEESKRFVHLKMIYKFFQTMVTHPFSSICVHNVCLTFISEMERNGYSLSREEIDLVKSLSDCSEGNSRSLQILKCLLWGLK